MSKAEEKTKFLLTYKFRAFVTYKAVVAGARVVRVNPSYTTQDCSVCSFRVPKTLAERLHKCPECGTELNRDYNASSCMKGLVNSR